ncbi:MAG TPA: hypothetical protein VJZ00_13660 [Thermoanaerobaculia bacterium]|nr:hypothetical protein [Thermoanaerobaculia bacterium]
MGRPKAKAKEKPLDRDELYKSLAVTEEQRRAVHEQMKADGERAKRDGVFERVRALRGKIKWSVSLEELRKDDD